MYEWDERRKVGSLELRCVPYDVQVVQRKLRATTMPDDLVHYLVLALERGGSPVSMARDDGHPLGDAVGGRAP
jgi:hypothetical protein